MLCKSDAIILLNGTWNYVVQPCQVCMHPLQLAFLSADMFNSLVRL